MLHEFVTTYRDAIVARTREKLTHRPWPTASTEELEHGVPLFLTQLSETLRCESTATPFAPDAIGASAALHGADLLALGFNVSQVVHDYGDICQAVTELAVEHEAPITTEEFHTLNRCLDTAIAEAVTEHARVTAKSKSIEEVERLGQLTHELRDQLNTAFFAFHALKRGDVAINGSTGAVLGRSLMGLRSLVDSTLADVRLAAKQQRQESVSVTEFMSNIAVSGSLDAEYRGVRFVVEPIAPDLTVNGDPQLLSSAVMNLLNNAFKFTRPGGSVVLRAYQQDRRLLIEVEDECGGIPDRKGEPFQPFGDKRGRDRSGLGLGLSIARKAVRAHGGDIQIRNTPGKGCIFVVEMPLAADAEPAPAAPIA
jgi:signal transduction histidine kinase